MPRLSQNKKIALSALAIFMISFAFMLLFLDSRMLDSHTSGANVLDATGGHAAPKVEIQELQNEGEQEQKKEETKGRKWMEKIYPTIKELRDDSGARLMVDKNF